MLAARCATAVGGLAINLIVDSDAPQSTSLKIATEVEGHTVLRTVRFADLPAGQPYEQIPRLSEPEISAFESSVRAALGGRYDDSQLLRFFQGMREAGVDVDWGASLSTMRLKASPPTAFAQRAASTCFAHTPGWMKAG